MFKKTMYALLGAAIMFAAAGSAQAQEWRLVNPSGVVDLKPVDPAPRLDSLEGKTIVLRWNGKHNGDVALDRVAERLQEAVPSAKIIKTYTMPDFQFVNTIAGNAQNSQRITDAVAGLKPDLVIGSTAD